MSTAEVFQAKVTKTETNMDRWDLIVNGDDTTDVVVDSGTVPSFAKLQAANLLTVTTSQNWAESAGEPGGSGTKSAKTWALESASSAALVLAGAGFNYTPTYLTSISTGSRASLLTITTGLAISVGAITNLINGSATNDDANGVRFASTQAVAGKALFTIVVNAIRYSGLFNQIKIKQSTNAAYGTYQIRLRTMDGAWEDHGSPVAVGGATEYTIDIPSISMDGYTGVELLGTSGTTPLNTIRMLEVELRAIEGPRNHVLPSPATPGLPGDRIVNGAFPDLAPVAQPRYNSPAAQGAVASNYEYWFDDADDIIRNRRGPLGWFDYSAGTYGKPSKTPKGRRFNKQMITSSWAGVRELMILKRCIIDMPINENEIATGVAGNPLYLKSSSYRDGMTVKALYPNGALGPVFSQTSGTVQINARYLNRGGWVLLFITLAADFTGTISLGGDINDGATATNRATECEIACIKTWPSALPDDAARLAEADWVCRELAYTRDIRVRGDECKFKRDIITMAGESQMGGQALMSDRPKQIREMASLPNILVHSHERADQPYAIIPAPFVAGATSRMLPFDTTPTVGYDGRQAGPEWKVAINHHLGKKPVPLGILHGGANSSMLGGSSALSWLGTQPPSTGLLYFHLTRIYDMWRWYLENDIAPNMIAFAWSQGWNNSNLAAPADYYNDYDIYYEDMIAKWLLYTGKTSIRQAIVQLPPLPAGNVTHDPAKFATVQTKLQALVTADTTNRFIIAAPTIPSNDAWGMSRNYQSDLLHYNAPLLDYQGDTIYAGITWSTY